MADYPAESLAETDPEWTDSTPIPVESLTESGGGTIMIPVPLGDIGEL
jgi:hypothetical protein